MITPDLEALGVITQEYAAFHARKSGLATALGGLMAMTLLIAPMWLDHHSIQIQGRCLLEYMLLAPFVWLVLKVILGRVLYQGLGTVKAMPDPSYERRRWFWILGLAGFLLAFLSLCLLGFASGFLNSTAVALAACPPPLWVLWLPLLYVVPMPWMIRGAEEARAYAVLVGLCVLWLSSLFLLSFGTRSSALLPRESEILMVQIGVVALLLAVLIWGALAMVRGWKEHREYLALLRSLPTES